MTGSADDDAHSAVIVDVLNTPVVDTRAKLNHAAVAAENRPLDCLSQLTGGHPEWDLPRGLRWSQRFGFLCPTHMTLAVSVGNTFAELAGARQAVQMPVSSS